jgi:hypothetical protein
VTDMTPQELDAIESRARRQDEMGLAKICERAPELVAEVRRLQAEVEHSREIVRYARVGEGADVGPLNFPQRTHPAAGAVRDVLLRYSGALQDAQRSARPMRDKVEALEVATTLILDLIEDDGSGVIT